VIRPIRPDPPPPHLESIVSYRIGAFAAATRIVSELLIRIEYNPDPIRPLGKAGKPTVDTGQTHFFDTHLRGGRRGGTSCRTLRCGTQVPPPSCGCFGMVALHGVQTGRTVSFHFVLHGLACALSTRRFDIIPVQTALFAALRYML